MAFSKLRILFSNFVSRNYFVWFWDFWQNFEWKFDAICVLLFNDLGDQLGCQWDRAISFCYEEQYLQFRRINGFKRGLVTTFKTFWNCNFFSFEMGQRSMTLQIFHDLHKTEYKWWKIILHYTLQKNIWEWFSIFICSFMGF